MLAVCYLLPRMQSPLHTTGGCVQVGGFVMIHRDDMAKLVPQWLQRTVGLRADTEAARLAGEAASNRAGQRVKCGPLECPPRVCEG